MFFDSPLAFGTWARALAQKLNVLAVQGFSLHSELQGIQVRGRNLECPFETGSVVAVGCSTGAKKARGESGDNCA